MKIRWREHKHIVAVARDHDEHATLHTHGTWTRRVRHGGMEHEKAEYLHIFTTTDPDRFLVHLLDGDHWSYETRESVEAMREDFDGTKEQAE